MLIGAHDADADAATRSRHALALEAGALAAVLCAMRELAHVDVMTQRGLMALGVIVGRRRSTLKVPPPPPPSLAAPQLGPCASSGRAWRLRAAQHSQKEADPLGAQPLPRLLELAASKVADLPAFGPCRCAGEHAPQR